jgi:hypothetical protein
MPLLTKPTRNPSDVRNDPSNPQTWNRYAYVMDNPLSYVDPLGLVAPGPCGTDGSLCSTPDPSLPPSSRGPYYTVSEWDDIHGKRCGVVPLRPCPANNNGTNCTPLTPGCFNVPTAEQQCIGNFYNSTLGKAAAFGSSLALLPGWNPQWGSTMGDWAEAIVGKGGGIFGTGAAGTVRDN